MKEKTIYFTLVTSFIGNLTDFGNLSRPEQGEKPIHGKRENVAQGDSGRVLLPIPFLLFFSFLFFSFLFFSYELEYRRRAEGRIRDLGRVHLFTTKANRARRQAFGEDES